MADNESKAPARPSLAQRGDREVQPKPFISEGVRQDVETYGKATDPATGQVITRDDLDKYGLRDLTK